MNKKKITEFITTIKTEPRRKKIYVESEAHISWMNKHVAPYKHSPFIRKAVDELIIRLSTGKDL